MTSIRALSVFFTIAVKTIQIVVDFRVVNLQRSWNNQNQSLHIAGPSKRKGSAATDKAKIDRLERIIKLHDKKDDIVTSRHLKFYHRMSVG